MAVTENKKIFTVQVPLRWGDMDAYGHINNVAVFRLLEEARVAVFGCPPPSGEPVTESPQPLLPFFSQLPQGTQALVAENRAKYLAPLPYRALPAYVEMSITQITPATISLAYAIHDPVTGARCVKASTVLAFFNTNNETIVRLDREQRRELTNFLAEA